MEGKPTGIKREDLSGPHGVVYHGERATVVEIRDAGSGAELLLGFGDREVLLFGYFNDDDEFIHIEDPILY